MKQTTLEELEARLDAILSTFKMHLDYLRDESNITDCYEYAEAVDEYFACFRKSYALIFRKAEAMQTQTDTGE